MLKVPSEAFEKYFNVDKMSVYIKIKNIKSPSFLQAFTESTLLYLSFHKFNHFFMHTLLIGSIPSVLQVPMSLPTTLVRAF